MEVAMNEVVQAILDVGLCLLMVGFFVGAWIARGNNA
jgi:uncharacterized protein YneF (UPF0154 family)